MYRLGITLLALGVIGGCANQPETIDTSGSHPTMGARAPMTPEAKDAEVDTGRLVVQTPRTPEANRLNGDESSLNPYSGYTVYTEEGHKISHENNHGMVPAEHKLAPGRYFVRLDHEVPQREFWVTVERGKVTRVENSQWVDSPATVK